MIDRSWKTCLAGMMMAGCLFSSVFAGEGCSSSTVGLDCQGCEDLFADTGQQLTDQLAQMSCCNASSCCAPTSVCECADPGCAEGCCGAKETCCGIEIGGWIQMGYHSGVTPNAAAVFDAGSFNNHPHRFNLHQGWLYAEKVADGSNGVGFGFRADVMYGVDAGDTQAFGNNPGRFDIGADFQHGQYGFAIPQLYAEVASGDLSVKVGHFFTLIGYEVVTAPDNFFYSHSLTMFNSEPFTHTGALATYAADDETSLYAGWTTGWDTGFDRFNNGSSFLGGFSTAVSEDITFTYITTAGNFGQRNDGYSHSLVFDVTLTDDLNYVLQSDLVDTNSPAGTPGEEVGINQYLFYAVDDNVKLGTRMEWWKRDGNSQYATTFGVNVKPMDNFIIRPEYRYDWAVPGGRGTASTFGVDAILTF
jgi:hypothetical protein